MTKRNERESCLKRFLGSFIWFVMCKQCYSACAHSDKFFSPVICTFFFLISGYSFPARRGSPSFGTIQKRARGQICAVCVNCGHVLSQNILNCTADKYFWDSSNFWNDKSLEIILKMLNFTRCSITPSHLHYLLHLHYQCYLVYLHAHIHFWQFYFAPLNGNI